MNLSWQTLQEMTCFFLGTKVTPNVWLMTAFCTGSICKRRTGVRGHQPAQDGSFSQSRSVLPQTQSRTVLKFGKSPTGEVVSTGNGRNGFIITEGPVVAPMRPGNAPPTALHPLPGNREQHIVMDFEYVINVSLQFMRCRWR